MRNANQIWIFRVIKCLVLVFVCVFLFRWISIPSSLFDAMESADEIVAVWDVLGPNGDRMAVGFRFSNAELEDAMKVFKRRIRYSVFDDGVALGSNYGSVVLYCFKEQQLFLKVIISKRYTPRRNVDAFKESLCKIGSELSTDQVSSIESIRIDDHQFFSGDDLTFGR